MNFLGTQALISLISHILFIVVTFWSLKGLLIEKWIKKNHIQQARLLYLFLSIAIGYLVSSFFIEFILMSRNLIFLF
ncbi:conserved hypothetical integral membrane protein [Carnobacterium iners]|uniref:Conserved hypothetical integral membrane protein n=1 Tax=Carnobacterium iners TaxID=1073423 RepID=A0A1X7N7E2_9LACT|nr:DUF1146 family protein [Carnobacterium iners]SEK45265.1 conserved hypothetical integral membrane protein [Carnobacterium iners]SMH32892.1 conserved hypothetical integral membrane protein [Carnobacterium iners]